MLFLFALGESDGKFAILAVGARNGNILAEVIHDGLADIKSEPNARFIEPAALIALIEAVENVRQVFVRDSLALVVNADEILSALVFLYGYAKKPALV